MSINWYKLLEQCNHNKIKILTPNRDKNILGCLNSVAKIQEFGWGSAFDTNNVLIPFKVQILVVKLPIKNVQKIH